METLNKIVWLFCVALTGTWCDVGFRWASQMEIPKAVDDGGGVAIVLFQIYSIGFFLLGLSFLAVVLVYTPLSVFPRPIRDRLARINVGPRRLYLLLVVLLIVLPLVGSLIRRFLLA